MSVEKILSAWKKGGFKPLYWLEGEEDFFIDQVMNYAEHNILSPSDAEFNLTVFYGRDANWAEVINACRRYPMFSQLQVVLLKEAQHMKDLDKLEGYILNPLLSTVFVISYKGKTVDKRTTLAKTLKDKGEILTSSKIYENKLPDWVNDYIESRGLTINTRALTLMIDHIGNDLSRITNEIEKLSLNMAGRKNITEDEIEAFVGISKDYNISELQKAFMFKNLAKAITIIQYIDSNPKTIPIQMFLPTLYGYFSKLLVVHQMPDRSENSIKHLFYNNPFAAREALQTLKNYDRQAAERAIMILHEYNLKTVGIRAADNSPGALLKEMAVKIINFN